MLRKTSQFSGKAKPNNQHLNLSESFCWVSLGVLLGFLGSTQSTAIAMITIIRSRGLLYAILRQTEKAKIDRQQGNEAGYQQAQKLISMIRQEMSKN
jgi:hypothetical protein